MILYLDPSALVPLLITEPTTDTCGSLWDAADSVVTTRLSHIEASAALAMAERLGRITMAEATSAGRHLKLLWTEIAIVEVDDALMQSAAHMARRHSLRGYDATHCAAAVMLNDDDVVAATGETDLLRAWQAEGLAVSDTNS